MQQMVLHFDCRLKIRGSILPYFFLFFLFFLQASLQKAKKELKSLSATQVNYLHIVALRVQVLYNINISHFYEDMLLNILAGFTYNIMTSGIIFFFLGLIPLAFIIAFSGLELGIAFIQAQVFVVLSSSYIKDGLDLH